MRTNIRKLAKNMGNGFNHAIPILMYHQLSPHPLAGFEKYCVTPEAFSRQMSWLAKHGYETIQPDALLEFQHGHRDLQPQTIMITFDDGFKDAFCYGPPILQKFGFTAVFFLVAGLMGESSHWLLAKLGVELPIMDWEDSWELMENGFLCGAHSMTHLRLSNLRPNACRAELLNSKLLLEDKLGQEVNHLAYPFGSYNLQVQRMASEIGYRSACSVEIGLSKPGDDPFGLHRVPVNGQDSQLDFIFKIQTALGFKDWIRSLAQKKRTRQQVFHKPGNAVKN